MTKRIFRSICIAAFTVLFVTLAFITAVLYSYFSDVQMQQLLAQARLVAKAVEADGLSYLETVEDDDCRITWIDSEGNVLFDNRASSTEMENHLERQEIIDALKNGEGESKRYSTTMMERQLYSAVRLDDGTVIRLSGSQNTWLSLLLGMLRPMLAIVFFAVVLSMLLAARLSSHIVEPLNSLNLDAPASNTVYEELAPLLNRIESQQEQLRAQASELEKKREEFESATGNMSEGVVLLNEHGAILSINAAASRLLNISRYCVGKDITLVSSLQEIRQAIEAARHARHTEASISLEGVSYQLNASPVMVDNRVSGIAILLLDTTEKEKAEIMRREFTANVSHELKTPLQSILGGAELLSAGVVKREDVPAFSKRIYDEAKRMSALVEDIVRLSHFDEGVGELELQTVDLYEIAQETVGNLRQSAASSGVELKLLGGPAKVKGIRQLLGDIVFNLCDNGIKYNKKGGRVTVFIEERSDSVMLSVSDTGIGIPKDQQERIFERFYRVDKSRSRAVGGTGLGLSIVKHAAKLHNAKITIDSLVGRGTVICVIFPRADRK